MTRTTQVRSRMGGVKSNASTHGTFIIALVVTNVLSGCAAEPENPGAGSCSLNCAKPRVGGAEFLVQPLVPSGFESFNVFCSADFAGQKKSILPTNGPVQVKFQVLEQLPPFGTTVGAAGSSSSSGGSSSGGSSSSSSSSAGTITPYGTPLANTRPVSGVGFEPWIFGLVAAEMTAPEFQTSKTADGKAQVSSFKYSSVVTPSAEWCSDSCGVMTYEFYPECISGKTNPIQAGVAVQGATNLRAYKISVQNQ